MSASASYFKLGLFVIVGTLLVAGAIAVLGAGALLQEYTYFETYFDTSVQGLSVGSPVKYRGVDIGAVSEIDLCRHKYPEEIERESRYDRYVYVRIQVVSTEQNANRKVREERLDRWIQAGMRVRLASQGITGLAYLEVDFLTVDDHPILPHNWEPDDFYVPSAPSTIAQISESIVSTLSNVEKVDFQAIGQNVNKLLVRVNSAIDELRIGDVTNDLEKALEESQGAFGKVRELLEKPETDQAVNDLAGTLSSARGMVEDLRPSVKELTGKFTTTADRFTKLAEDLDAIVTSDEFEQALKEMPGLASQLRMTAQRANQLLASERQNLHTIVENLRLITEHIEAFSKDAKQYPSRLLFGEPPREANLKAED